MGDARRHIKERNVANCVRADPTYGDGVARALRLDLKKAGDWPASRPVCPPAPEFVQMGKHHAQNREHFARSDSVLR
jgi:hypothetical protein